MIYSILLTVTPNNTCIRIKYARKSKKKTLFYSKTHYLVFLLNSNVFLVADFALKCCNSADFVQHRKHQTFVSVFSMRRHRLMSKQIDFS